MTTKLAVYNQALLLLGEEPLVATTDAVTSRYALDAAWDLTVAYCLAQGMWQFALRFASLTQVAGGAGFEYGYTKPTDLIHVFALAENDSFNPPLDRDYHEGATAFYSNLATLCLRYSSKHSVSGGLNLDNWPSSFTLYVAAALARTICMRVTGSLGLMMAMQDVEDASYLTAYAVDSVALPKGKPPFNAVSRNPGGDDPIGSGPMLLPFAAGQVAMTRMRGRQK